MYKSQDKKTNKDWPFLITREALRKIPKKIGIYRFVDKKNKLLYIGKASNLKNRVGSYFSKNLEIKRSPLVAKMIEEAKSVKYEILDSVLDALIKEAYLIKKFSPPYNTADKDQKSFYFIVITKETFPRVLLAREREIKNENFKFNIDESFGPYPNGGELKEALKIIRKIFPYRDKCIPTTISEKQKNIKPCFNFQIGLCPGVCTGAVSKDDYKKTIKNIKKLLRGERKTLIKNIEKDMNFFAQKKEFEKAQVLKKKIFALKHINDVALIRANMHTDNRLEKEMRIEAYDIAHLSGTNMVGVMIVIENGEINKKEHRIFKIKNQDGVNDTKALYEVLTRRLKHNEWKIPNLIVVDGNIAQINTASKALEQSSFNIPVVAVTKDDKHKPKYIQSQEKELENTISKYRDLILLANNEAHRFAVSYHRKLRSKMV